VVKNSVGGDVAQARGCAEKYKHLDLMKALSDVRNETNKVIYDQVA